MVHRVRLLAGVLFTTTLVALALRATASYTIGDAPLIYRSTVSVNDLDSVEGLGVPGRFIQVWAKQRNFIEGEDGTGDPFSWCTWKNHGASFFVGSTWVDGNGHWALQNLRAGGTTVTIFPAGPGEDRCLGGLYTELLVSSCTQPGVGCTTPDVPTLHFLNVRRIGSNGVTSAAVSGADQAAAAVADGPNDGPDAPGNVDVDQNGVDTTKPGFTPGQRVAWRCAAGGTLPCPSVVVHDASTVVAPDPEYPFIVGTVQAHRPGGSIIAAAAIPRGEPIGFAVNVNVRFRGLLDVNLGCDQPKFFDFSS
jgi:hypothetical protein